MVKIKKIHSKYIMLKRYINKHKNQHGFISFSNLQNAYKRYGAKSFISWVHAKETSGHGIYIGSLKTRDNRRLNNNIAICHVMEYGFMTIDDIAHDLSKYDFHNMKENIQDVKYKVIKSKRRLNHNKKRSEDPYKDTQLVRRDEKRLTENRRELTKVEGKYYRTRRKFKKLKNNNINTHISKRHSARFLNVTSNNKRSDLKNGKHFTPHNIVKLWHIWKYVKRGKHLKKYICGKTYKPISVVSKYAYFQLIIHNYSPIYTEAGLRIKNLYDSFKISVPALRHEFMKSHVALAIQQNIIKSLKDGMAYKQRMNESEQKLMVCHYLETKYLCSNDVKMKLHKIIEDCNSDIIGFKHEYNNTKWDVVCYEDDLKNDYTKFLFKAYPTNTRSQLVNNYYKREQEKALKQSSDSNTLNKVVTHMLKQSALWRHKNIFNQIIKNILNNDYYMPSINELKNVNTNKATLIDELPFLTKNHISLRLPINEQNIKDVGKYTNEAIIYRLYNANTLSYINFQSNLYYLYIYLANINHLFKNYNDITKNELKNIPNVPKDIEKCQFCININKHNSLVNTFIKSNNLGRAISSNSQLINSLNVEFNLYLVNIGILEINNKGVFSTSSSGKLFFNRLSKLLPILSSTYSDAKESINVKLARNILIIINMLHNLMSDMYYWENSKFTNNYFGLIFLINISNYKHYQKFTKYINHRIQFSSYLIFVLLLFSNLVKTLTKQNNNLNACLKIIQMVNREGLNIKNSFSWK